MAIEPTEEEIKKAAAIDKVADSLKNYFLFIDITNLLENSENYLGILTLKEISIGNGVALGSRKIFILDDSEPYNINDITLTDTSPNFPGPYIDKIEPIPDGTDNDGKPLYLNLYSLILHIYEAGTLNEAQKKIIENDFIKLFQADIHEAKPLKNEIIKRSIKGLKIPTKTLKMNAYTIKVLVGDKFRKSLDGQETLIPQGKNGNLGYSIIAFNYKGDDVTIKKSLTDFDMAVCNAISNIFIWKSEKKENNRAHIPCIPEDIWATMNGITNKRVKLTEKRRQDIIKSVDKLRHTDAWINLSKEKGLTYKEDTSFINQTYKGTLLHADYITDDKTTIFEVLRLPILFEYCAMKNQIITIETALLDVTDTASNTDKVIIFRDLLITEIKYMQFDPKTSRKRLLSTLYEKTTLEEPQERKAKSDDIETISKILTSWKNRKADLNFIDDFYFTTPGTNPDGTPKEAKPRQKIDGIYIKLSKKYDAIEESTTL